MKEAIYARLSGDPALNTLVGDRITPGRRDQGTGLPAVVYHVISAPRRRTLRGRTAMVQGRIQIDCWGATEDQADLTGKAVKAALEGARFTHNGDVVRGVFLIEENEDAGSDAEGRPFLSRMDFRVHFIPA
jgi:hypothetical protein